MGLITWAKKVIGMIFKRQAEEDFNVESVVSPEMESKITVRQYLPGYSLLGKC